MMIQLRLQKRVLLQLQTTLLQRTTLIRMIRQHDQMVPIGSNHSHRKASLIDDADDNIIYRINGTVDVVAIDKVMS